MNLAYCLYMGEKEGYLSTRESKIQKVIKNIKNYDAAAMPESVFKRVLIENGIEPSSLTERELNRIQDAIR